LISEELDSELRRRAYAVLRQLEMLAEAPTRPLESESAHTKPGSKPPVLGRDNLFLFYRGRFWSARSDEDLRFQVYCAERDLEIAQCGSRIIGTGLDTAKNAEALETEMRRRLVEDMASVEAEAAAVLLYTSVAWVKRVRGQNNLHAADGTPKPPFLNYDEDKRREVVSKYRQGGMSLRRIAAKLGVTDHTVRRYAPEN
jgi:hypothetical protein